MLFGLQLFVDASRFEKSFVFSDAVKELSFGEALLPRAIWIHHS